MSKIEKAILRTLAFFDIFKRPLTLEELWQNLYQLQASKIQVLLALRDLQKKRVVAKNNPYYCLAQNQQSFKVFEDNRQLRIANWQKVDRVIKILKFVPFIKNISVINSLSFNASGKDSDIDILIMTAKNRLWTARAFAVMILELLGQNKNQWHQAGKFCLGFAFSQEQLNLKHLQLRNDIYFTYWLAMLKPVWDRKIYQKFILENGWIFQKLPNWQEKETESYPEKKSIFEKILSGKFGTKLEKFLGELQINKIWRSKENHRPGASVVADFKMMKLHAYDRRSLYQKRWEEKLRALKILTY